jgi:L-asparagine transporter-like permease
MTTKHHIKTTFYKAIISFVVIILFIILSFAMLGCANVDKVQEREGWFPVGMDEDSQSFYNSKYNTLDNGQKDPNMNIKVFNAVY